jgi:glucoamylase
MLREAFLANRSSGVCLFVAVAVALLMTPVRGFAADAQDAPGNSSAWTTGAKQGVGTSATNQSKLWYTIGQGILHEVYFPLADTPNVQDLQFVVTDGAGFTDLERDATTHAVQLVDPQALVYRQINTAWSGRYRITKTYVTDPARPTLLIETRFEALTGGPYNLYVLYNPSLDNSGMGDTGGISGDALVASDEGVASALITSPGFVELSNGYSGKESDGLSDLMANRKLTARFDRAPAPGNIAQTGRVAVGSDTTFTLALGFGGNRTEAEANARASLGAGFGAVRGDYAKGWHDWLATLDPPPASVTSTGLRTQYDVALMVLKAHEDKTFSGANVASLTIPWGQIVGADTCCPQGFGYHSVWPRDLYHVATALLAAGDRAAAERSLDYTFKVQQKPDGSMPQNSKIDGSPTNFHDLQMDQVAFPIILAWQLGRTDSVTWHHVRLAADFIISHAAANGGPRTPQERWEEESGFSPSTIAAEIAGLVTAADIAQINGDPARERNYLAAADEWQRQIGSWTFTTTGPHGDKRYYERIDQGGDPNDQDKISINNGGGEHEERAIVDAGFLDLVRLGVKPPQDLSIADGLQEVDQVIRVERAGKGPLFYRYNNDGYGEKGDGSPFKDDGIGRLWPLLTGERGEYELARGGSATAHLQAMALTANEGLMLPEQVWDRDDTHGFTFGEGTDSATPLAWSMAQFVRLALSIDAGKPVETPSIVAQRYGVTSGVVEFEVEVPADVDLTGKTVVLAGELNRMDSSLPEWNPAAVKLTKINATRWRATVNAPAGAAVRYKYTLGDWSSVEGTGSCADRNDRTVVASFGPGSMHRVQDRVDLWRNMGSCGNGG